MSSLIVGRGGGGGGVVLAPEVQRLKVTSFRGKIDHTERKTDQIVVVFDNNN